MSIAVDADAAAFDFVEASEQVDDRGLAGTGWTDQRHDLAGFGGERHVLDRE